LLENITYFYLLFLYIAYLTGIWASNTLAGLIVSPEPSDPVGLGGPVGSPWSQGLSKVGTASCEREESCLKLPSLSDKLV
jgi:hypothetical protein